MARYFAINSLAGAKRSSPSAIEVTTGGTFDSAYVGNSIRLDTTNVIEIPLGIDGTSATTLYFRYDAHFGLAPGSNQGNTVVFYNGTTPVYRLAADGGGNHWLLQYWNSGSSTWVTWSVTNGGLLPVSTRMTLLFKLICGTSFELFNGGISFLASIGAPTNAASQVTAVRLSGHRDSGNFHHVSQLMAADYDIRDARFQIANLSGTSATNTSGSGAHTDINEVPLDDGTAVVLAAAGKRGQTKSSITVPVGYGIAGMVINGRGRVAGGTVTDGRLGVRSSGVESASSNLGYTGNYEPRSAFFPADPNTSAAWTNANFNSAEIFEQAV